MPLAPQEFKGKGRSFASFGEIIQGRKRDCSDFLMTLPIDLWSFCDLEMVLKEGPLVINCDLSKSKSVAEIVLKKLGIFCDCQLDIAITKNIPEGKGLSSSTADMLATLRALQNTFGFELSSTAISQLFKLIEPHDGLMYDASVLYNHRQGQLLKCFHYIPSFRIIAVDCGGIIDSIEYNKKLSFCDESIVEYEALYSECITAYKQKDDLLIAKCATRSLKIALMNNKNYFKELLLESFEKFEALGVVNTHSGTCIGFIYNNLDDQGVLRMMKRIEVAFKLPVFATSTLSSHPTFQISGENNGKIRYFETLDQLCIPFS